MLTQIQDRHRRALTLTLGALLALVLIGFGLHNAIAAARAATPSAQTHPGALEFNVLYTGGGAEGVDLIWRGPLEGASAGVATIRVAYTGTEADRSRPVWPVRALLFVSADDLPKSFISELAGTIDWQSGEMHLSGPVTDGWQRGARIEQTLAMDRPWFDGTSTIRLVERTAQR